MNVYQSRALTFAITLLGLWVPLWTEEIEPVNIVAGGEFPAVARGPNGSLHIVYGTNDGRIRYRSYDLSSRVLSPAETTGASYIDDYKARPAVAVDSKGWVHVSGSTYSFRSGGSWQTIDTGLSRDTAIAVDSRDNVYILTRGTNESEYNGPGYIQIIKRLSGANSFTSLTNVDHAQPGRNNHVYGAIAISPADDSIHVVYRHAAPREHSYRKCTGERLEDGSIDIVGTWTVAEGISSDRREGPAVTVDRNGVVYSLGGNGTFYRRAAADGSWSSEGVVVDGGERHGPRLVSDGDGSIYATAWGGKYNVRRNGSWIGQRTVPSLSGKAIGHIGTSSSDNDHCYVVWEESDSPGAASGGGLANLVLATINESGQLESVTGGTTGETGNTAKDLGDLGAFRKWSKIEVPLRGPTGAGTSVTSSPNPFTSMKVDVTFRGPGGTFNVPGFYDGNGSGGTSGNVWKVRFSANSTGSWTFESSSSVSELDRIVGSFSVTSPTASSADFFKHGRLEFVGGHYLKFADGGYWIKAGIDDPENFLGDPFGSWSGKKAAVDFLSSKGVNSIYLITNNTGAGDGKDSWPWLGSTESSARQNSDRFNVGKLLEWESFFAHCQTRGLVLHIILDDDSAWDGYDHDLYYREMVARFGHHPALIWNIGEEANEIYSTNEQVQLANRLRGIDPFGHPITVHRKNRWPFLGNTAFDLTSIQTEGTASFTAPSLAGLNAMVIDHRKRSANGGHAIPVFVDETPRVTQVNDSTRKLMRGYVLYPILLGGGGYELHYTDEFGQGNLTIQMMEPMWEDMKHARQFVESLPFHTMEPRNNLLSVDDDNYCFAAPGTAYGIYLGDGGEVELDLRNVTGTFTVTWHNVRTGATQNGSPIDGGRQRRLGTPPFSGDSAVTVIRAQRGSAALPLPPINLVVE